MKKLKEANNNIYERKLFLIDFKNIFDYFLIDLINFFSFLLIQKKTE